MTPKATGAHLQWLQYLQVNGAVRGDRFSARVKGTCARREWATWDRLSATWTITKAGVLVLRREQALQNGRNASSLHA
jgi:hypothetical protein